MLHGKGSGCQMTAGIEQTEQMKKTCDWVVNGQQIGGQGVTDG